MSHAIPLSTTLPLTEETISFDESTLAQGFSPETSAYSKYRNLLQVLNCPEDGAVYGNFHDYGYWDGGAWCGEQGAAGYWVWSAPNWYVWQDKVPEYANAGKYSSLLQVIYCPGDESTYGSFDDYGYWGGGPWCGDYGKAGFWVYSAPNWYVWEVDSE
ncbi:hypothetical protein [Leptothoe kymatousa]|uniref:Uncharacterized protein n=1 Tax=Leptothoe kymatousa TAU-MAC 1615 TaxID=2364775 RepID=A0ABS5Y1A1_9CYAN|nr:hypothetical protein [Leptothoe kymatousa]MBT9311588.1 hypothetical protein [Leptothoe kymatousa TAU-MAC 1615]